jgi:hypothetical protein
MTHKHDLDVPKSCYRCDPIVSITQLILPPTQHVSVKTADATGRIATHGFVTRAKLSAPPRGSPPGQESGLSPWRSRSARHIHARRESARSDATAAPQDMSRALRFRAARSQLHCRRCEDHGAAPGPVEFRLLSVARYRHCDEPKGTQAKPNKIASSTHQLSASSRLRL